MKHGDRVHFFMLPFGGGKSLRMPATKKQINITIEPPNVVLGVKIGHRREVYEE